MKELTPENVNTPSQTCFRNCPTNSSKIRAADGPSSTPASAPTASNGPEITLVMLGISANRAAFLMPRDVWDVMPGGMPCFVVKDI